MDNPNHVKRFLEKRKNSMAKKLFLKVLEYIYYSYEQIVENKITYSQSYCKEKTAYAFEDFLKIRLVTDYLQKRKNKLNFRFANEILPLAFQYETEKEYYQNDTLKSDKIDIFISNLVLKGDNWSDTNKEDLYFVVECKRLKNTGKTNAYLTDSQKFVERSYTTFRFPFNGMIGFIEKSSITIPDIIEDVNLRLLNHNSIKSKIKDAKIILDFPIRNIKHCKIATHYHSITNQEIEVFHLFLDYTNVIAV